MLTEDLLTQALDVAHGFWYQVSDVDWCFEGLSWLVVVSCGMLMIGKDVRWQS